MKYHKIKVVASGSFCLLLFAFYLFTFTFALARGPQLLETGSASKLRSPAPSTSEIKIVSYNIRYRGGEDLQKLVRLLREDMEIGHAAIVGLQEVDRNKKRTGNVNTARMMAEELGLYYAWAAPPPPTGKGSQEEEETGVAILSEYPLMDVTRIVLPNEGPGGRHRVALGATVRVGAHALRLYSVHAETRTTKERRLEQFQAVLDDLQTYHTKVERAVVLGDFNTIFGRDVHATSSLFTGAGFTTPFPDDETTWRTFIIELKLDWIWLRGLRATTYGIDKKIGLSDHWPLWVNVKFDAGAQSEMDIRGKITNVNRANADGAGDKLLGTLFIEGVKEADTKFDKASVRITNETRIFDQRRKERRQVSFDDLKIGQKVGARFVGPVMESYPVQANASEVVILR